MEARMLDLFESAAHIASSIPDNVFTSPDDDWLPVLMLEAQNGDTVTVPIHDFMDDEFKKDMLAEILMPAVIADVKATKAVMVFSAWTSKIAAESVRDGSGDYLPPSQQPDREEYVVIIEYTRDGVTRQAWGKIMRSETEIPRLGEWEELPVDRFEGRFVDPIVKALKGVKV